MAPKTRNAPDLRFDHVVKHVLSDLKSVRECLADAGITTYHGLLEVGRDPNKVNALKWKDPQTKSDEPLSEDDKNELGDLKNFVNWLQNEHGTRGNYDIDVIAKTNRDLFLTFMTMNPAERRGNPDGTVDYDVTQARESEKFNQLGRFAPPPTPAVVQATTPQGGGSNNNSGRNSSAAETVALNTFEKKLSINAKDVPLLKSTAQWNEWVVPFKVYLKLSGIQDLVERNYVVPDANSHQDAVALHEKKNTVLFSALLTCVQTPDGKAILKEYYDSMDGVAAYNKILTFHTTDLMATSSAQHFMNLITNSRMPPREQLKKSRVEYLADFRGWIGFYNQMCNRGSELTVEMQLVLFKQYISLQPEILNERNHMDLQENPGLGSQAVKYDATMRMNQYERKARQLDHEAVQDAVTSNRSKPRYAHFTELELLQISSRNPYARDDDVPTVPGIQVNMTVVDDYYANYEVNVAAQGRRYGYLPKELYLKLDPEHRKSWMSIPADMREMIMTSVVGSAKPSPPTPSDHRLPGTGLVGRKARADNQDETNPVPSVSTVEGNMTIIQALKAKSATSTTRAVKTHPTPNLRHDGPLQFSSQHKPPYDVRHLIGAKPEDVIPTRTATIAITRSSESHAASLPPDLLTPNLLKNDSVSHANRSVSMAVISYQGDSSGHEYDEDNVTSGGLIDAGANNGVANPQEMRLLSYASPPRGINISGVGNHDNPGLRVATFAVKVQLQDGRFVLLIFPEYGELTSGPTIHPKIQLRDGGCEVFDEPELLGGKQCIVHENGSCIPLDYRNGLPYIKMIYPSDEDITSLPRLFMTRDVPWNPSKYDNSKSNLNIADDSIHVNNDERHSPSIGESHVNTDERHFPSIGELVLRLGRNSNATDHLLRCLHANISTHIIPRTIRHRNPWILPGRVLLTRIDRLDFHHPIQEEIRRRPITHQLIVTPNRNHADILSFNVEYPLFHNLAERLMLPQHNPQDLSPSYREMILGNGRRNASGFEDDINNEFARLPISSEFPHHGREDYRLGQLVLLRPQDRRILDYNTGPYTITQIHRYTDDVTIQIHPTRHRRVHLSRVLPYVEDVNPQDPSDYVD